MEVIDALKVESKNLELLEQQDAIHRAAIVVEQAEIAAAEEANIELPSAKMRFAALGERIIALADEDPAVTYGPHSFDCSGRQHTSTVELDTRGLAISATASESYTRGSLRGFELSCLNIIWLSTSNTTETPFARQEVDISEVMDHSVTPEVFGMLRLMEQSITAAELALQANATVPA